MKIEKSKFTDLLEKLKTSEGLVILGAGGDLQDWLKGISKFLHDEAISPTDDPEKMWESAYELVTTGGRVDLVLVFKEPTEFQIGKMAMWRLAFGDASWWSDYKVNYRSHHGMSVDEEDDE